MTRGSKLVGAVGALLLSGGCAMHSPYPMMRPVRAYPTQAQTPAPVTGRWDNVMMLARGTSVVVLLSDGRQAEGPIVSASLTAIKLSLAGGEMEFPADDVLRVDRQPKGTRVRDAANGALHGAGAVALVGLIAGRVPPARLFGAGAIAGAEMGSHAAAPTGPHTVYLSPRLRNP